VAVHVQHADRLAGEQHRGAGDRNDPLARGRFRDLGVARLARVPGRENASLRQRAPGDARLQGLLQGLNIGRRKAARRADADLLPALIDEHH
jgi:hypothetical protein